MNHSDMLIAVAMTTGAVLIIWQILVAYSKSRVALKRDLEILNLLPPTSIYADKLRKRVEKRLKKNYGSDGEISWSGFAYAAVIFIFFAIASYFNLNSERVMLAYATTALAMLSLLSAVCQLSPGEQN